MDNRAVAEQFIEYLREKHDLNPHQYPIALIIDSFINSDMTVEDIADNFQILLDGLENRNKFVMTETTLLRFHNIQEWLTKAKEEINDFFPTITTINRI